MGPYCEGPQKFRLKIAENGIERSLVFHSEEEAGGVKEELLEKHGKTTKKTPCGRRATWWIAESAQCQAKHDR